MDDEQDKGTTDENIEYPPSSFTQDEFTGRIISQASLDELRDRMENERFWASLSSHIQEY